MRRSGGTAYTADLRSATRNGMRVRFSPSAEIVIYKMQTIDLERSQGAIFSEDMRYRYTLWRVWSQTKPLLLFIGLNPSIASQLMNDPTITRLMARAFQEGYGGLLAANLYALVSTNPTILMRDANAIGSETDDYIRQMVDLSNGKALCAWGSFPAAKVRASAVLKMIREPFCLGVNKDGQPKHPLYVGYNMTMVKFNAH